MLENLGTEQKLYNNREINLIRRISVNIYDFLRNYSRKNELDGIDKNKIIEKFIGRFIDSKLVPQNYLLWNSIKFTHRGKVEKISLEKINTINIKNLDCMYIYLERHKALFQGNIQIIIDFLEQQEPWEETDITVFDESYNWFMAFTHDDEVLYVRL